jgi:hypothetical protein
MKVLFVTLLVVVLLGTLVALLVSFKFGDIETPKYKVIKTIGSIEIRQYPKMLVAQTTLPDTTMDKSMSSGFRTIAGYIFGGNTSNQKIAMTAPVVVKMADTATMYFVMPGQYKKEDLPKPNSERVQLREEGEKTLAVITYSGYSSDEKIALYSKKLKSELVQHNIQTVGAFLYMGYNAPWDLINRRNEVAIEVVLN